MQTTKRRKKNTIKQNSYSTPVISVVLNLDFICTNYQLSNKASIKSYQVVSKHADLIWMVFLRYVLFLVCKFLLNNAL